MPAIARSEPFREQACPLGVCDGSGWILGPEDVARPCECREPSGCSRGRSRGVASVIPPRYRGVSFDRPPVTDMAGTCRPDASVSAVRELRRRPRREPRRRARPLADGRHRHRQDDAGDAGLQGGAGGRQARSRSTRCRSCWRGSAAPTTPNPAATPTSPSSSGSPRSTCSTSTTSAPRSAPTGCSSSSTRSSTSATRAQRSMLVTTNLDVDEQQLEEQIGSRTVSRLIEICGDPLPLVRRRDRARTAGARASAASNPSQSRAACQAWS